MYDPKFEKAIQQKMEELEFRPPEAVWVNIEKAVMVKRRRRAGFVWKYLLPAAVLVAVTAGVYEHYTATHAPSTHTPDMHAPAAQAGVTENGSAASQSPVSDRSADGSAIDKSAVDKSAISNGDVANGRVAGRSLTGNGATNRSAHRITRQGSVANETGALTETNTLTEPNALSETNKTVGSDDAMQSGQNRLPVWFYRPGLVDQRLIPQVQASALNTKKGNTVNVKGLSHPERRWEAGFVAGGGLSRLNRLNSDQAKAAVAAAAASIYTLANSSSSKQQYISNVRQGASFDGGIYLQRALSDRWIFNTGMDLHYYSNRISVGQQVTTYVAASASYFIPNTSPSVQTSSVYSAGDTRSFTNKYYFLELPVGLQWKLNKSHLLPIFVEGGVSLSRLMGASALFYNAKTGFYSKDGDIVNKTQFNVSSALLVGLPFHGVNIQLGPQIQYGLTPLVNTQGVGDQHFLYTGIRIVVIPGGK